VIMTQLVYLAKQGNVMAAREVLDRCLGTSFNPMEIVEMPRRRVLHAIDGPNSDIRTEINGSRVVAPVVKVPIRDSSSISSPFA